MGNKINGAALKDITMDKLAEDYGVSDEDQRKKIYYNLKDVLKKDSYAVRPRARAPPAPTWPRLMSCGPVWMRRATPTTTRRC